MAAAPRRKRSTPASGKTPGGNPPGPEEAALVERVRDAVVGWFSRGHRDLPWRRTGDPYAVWVSEIMLQQTRVDTVTPRFVRWMERFPSVTALAEASLDEVLGEWAGLGYYARARNLHAAARQIQERYGGRFPDEAGAIEALPGVGRYTAGAIRSIAFGQPAPLVDGNVERVLSRVFRVDGDVRSAPARERLWALSAALVVAGAGRPLAALHKAEDGSLDGDAATQSADAAVQRGPAAAASLPSAVNQGLMELGALVCTPSDPRCLLCPLSAECQARRDGVVDRYPEVGRATRVVALEMASVALRRDGKLLLLRRPPRGLWGGLYELPTGELRAGEQPEEAARRIVRETTGLAARGLRKPPPPHDRLVHVLSHRRITFHALSADAGPGAPRLDAGHGHDGFVWAEPSAIAGLGVSRATERLLLGLATGGAPERGGRGGGKARQ